MQAARSGWVPFGPRFATALLTGVSCAALVVSIALPAKAGNYSVSNEAQLRQAILDANADGDSTATITLLNDIDIVDPTAFPAFTKPVTIDTGTFVLQGADIASGAGDGTSLTFLGGAALIISGTERGGNADTSTDTGTAGIGAAGIVLGDGALRNLGEITGGAGGGIFRADAGEGGAGVDLTDSTLTNIGTITGGQGGNIAGVTGSSAVVFAGDGGTGVVMSGGSLDNRGSIIGGDAGGAIDANLSTDNAFGGVGGIGASLTGGTHVSSGSITGGTGGVGENAGGAAGGAGGLGLQLAGDASFTNNGTITGGTGGIEPFRERGSAGGAGVSIANSTLINNGTITSGTGGNTTTPGAGAVAILGTGGATVVNAATISGGLRGDGLVRSNAIQFSNGNNTLELRAGSVINGNVIASTGDTFALGGATDSSFAVSSIGSSAQYRNFGSYQKTGTSTWTLTGTTAATTSWQLLDGKLSVDSDTRLGAAAGTLNFDGGTLQVVGTSFTSTARTINWGTNGGGFDIADAANTFTVAQNLTGGGPLSKQGAGTLVLTGDNTYDGTEIEAGTLQIGDGGTAGSITGDVSNAGTLVFNRSDDIAFSGLISGSGVVNQIGAGTTTLTGDNTYTGLTTISAGTLQLGDGGTSGSIAGDIRNDSVLAFNRSDSFELPGAMSGTGAVEQNGTGTTVLTGNNTYTGGTTISNGTLQLGNGGTTGSIVGDVQNDGTLAFDRSDRLTFGGSISGTGMLRQIGNGITELTGSSSGFSGTTSVEAGTLAVNGTLCGDTNVLSGARLEGTGTLCDTTAASGGTVAPGNSIGTMTVNGAFTLASGAIYEVEVNAAGASDKVIVNGTVDLTGAALRVLAQNGGYNLETDYLIIDNDDTDAVIGTFGQVTTNLAFLTPIVLYDAGDGNDVVLTLLRTQEEDGSGPLSFCSVTDTTNQCNTATALERFPTNNPLFAAILGQTAAGARQAFDALSGEIHATVAGTMVDDNRYVREAVLGRLKQANATDRGDAHLAALGAGGPEVASLDPQPMALGYDGQGPSSRSAPLAFWTRAYGAWGDYDGDGNAAGADRDLGGFVSGMDAQLSGSWRAGLATGASFSNVGVGERYSSADVDSYTLGGYLGGMTGDFAVRSGGMWAWSAIDTSRAVVFPGFFERQKASYDANTGQLFGEIAYPTRMGSVALEPYAGLAYVSMDTEAFRERGGAESSLRGSSEEQDVGYSTVGLRAATTAYWGSMQVVPSISAAWQHAFDDITPGAALNFASTGIGFSVDGVPLAEDTALIDAGLDFSLGANTTAGISYSGQFGDGVTDNAVKGRFTWLF